MLILRHFVLFPFYCIVYLCEYQQRKVMAAKMHLER